MKRIIFIFLILFISENIHINGQISISPISMSESGKIYQNYSGKAISMSGTGISNIDKNLINFLNPAAYASLDSLTFNMNIGIFGTIVQYFSKDNSGYSANANIDHLSISFKVSRNIGISAGILPYNYIEYKLSSKVNSQGLLEKLEKNYRGAGGLNNLFAGISFRFGNNFYTGINLNFINGNIKREEIVSEPDFLEVYYNATLNNYYSGFFITPGIIYNPSFFKNLFFGITYQPEVLLNGNSEYYLCMNDYDTLLFSQNQANYKIPGKLGFGITLKGRKYTVATDLIKYSYEHSSRYFRLALGCEYKFKKNNINSKSLSFLTGFAYDFLPYRFYKNNIITYSFSMGIMIPINKNFLSLSFITGKYGLKNYNLLNENYYTIHIYYSLFEKWFERRKYY